MAVLGVDGCKDGWIGIVLDGRAEPRAVCAATITELVAEVGPVDVIGIDMPIGLPIRGTRECDLLAKRAVGRLHSSVFLTPTRRSLEALDHAEGNRFAIEDCGKGISRQAFALAPKILQVDAWVASSPARVVEVHPEVSFATLAGKALTDGKTTWAGMTHRRGLLEQAGIVLVGDLGLSRKKVAADDVLDAAVVAWTARRVHAGTATSLPSPPEVLDRGYPAAIWS